jgi:hypothetical protein
MSSLISHRVIYFPFSLFQRLSYPTNSVRGISSEDAASYLRLVIGILAHFYLHQIFYSAVDLLAGKQAGPG